MIEKIYEDSFGTVIFIGTEKDVKRITTDKKYLGTKANGSKFFNIENNKNSLIWNEENGVWILYNFETKSGEGLTEEQQGILNSIPEIKSDISSVKEDVVNLSSQIYTKDEVDTKFADITDIEGQVSTVVTDYLTKNPVSAEVTKDSVNLDSINKDDLFSKSVIITENISSPYKMIKLTTPITEQGKVIKVIGDITTKSKLDFQLELYNGSGTIGGKSSIIKSDAQTRTSFEVTLTTNNVEVVYISFNKVYSDQSNIGTIENIKVYVDEAIVGYSIEQPTSGAVTIKDDSNDYFASNSTLKKEIEKVEEQFKSISLDAVKNNVYPKTFTFVGEMDSLSFKLDNPLITNAVIRIKCSILNPNKLKANLRFKSSSTDSTNKQSDRISINTNSTRVDVDVSFNHVGTANYINLKKEYTSELITTLKICDLEIYVDNVIVGYSLVKSENIEDNTVVDSVASRQYVMDSVKDVKDNITSGINKICHLNVPSNNSDKVVTTLYFAEQIKINIGSKIILSLGVQPIGKQGLRVNTSLGVVDNTNTAIISTGDIRQYTCVNEVPTPNKVYDIEIENIATKKATVMRINIRANGIVNAYLYSIALNVDGEWYYPSVIENIVGDSTLENIIDVLPSKEYVTSKINEFTKTDFVVPFVNSLYSVGSSTVNREFGVPIFLDYCYGGFKEVSKDTRVTFTGYNSSNQTYGLNDRMYLYSKKMGNNTINNIKKNVKLHSNAYNVADLNFNHIVVDERVPNGKIYMLTIGDSVTAGAITKQQYWSFCAEFFAKEDLDLNRNSDVMMLGSNNCRTITVTSSDGTKEKEVKVGACGISSWSLNSWLTNVSTTTDYSNPSGLNGFTYVDDNGKTQFSILKWVERFRNYTDEGVKMQIGDEGLGTWITEDNIDKIVCCKPTHLYINSTHNGGTVEEHMAIINKAIEEIPDIKIIVGSPMPLLGTWFLDYYNDKDYILNGYTDAPNYSAQQSSQRIEYMKYWSNVEKTKAINNFYYFPQNVITPTIEGYEYDEIDVGFRKMKRITNQPMPKEHAGTYTHKIWGYELYALLKYISAINSDTTTTNVVSVALDISEKSLIIGETYTLTAVPSTTGTDVTFTSTDNSIATVSDSGVITAISNGECCIYAETSTSILPAVCKVTIAE